MKNLSIFILIGTILFSSCAKKTMLNTYQGKQIIFGKAGGIAGKGLVFHIVEDGKCYKKQGAEYVQVSKFTKKQTTLLFEQMHNIQQSALELNEIGNVYQYIKLQNADGTAYSLVWSNGNQAPKNIKILYNKLMAQAEVQQ